MSNLVASALPWLIAAVALVGAGMLLGHFLYPVKRGEATAAADDAVLQRNAYLLEHGREFDIRFTQVERGYDPQQVDAVLAALLGQRQEPSSNAHARLEEAARSRSASDENPSSEKER